MALLKYRREIDGLRALAVLPVVLFHARLDGFQGGYVGVDVFLVISGYLITSIIAGALQSGTFSLASFYERRARRILPALCTVVLASLPFAWLWMMPSQLKTFAQSLVAVATFSANLFFYSKSGYFEPAVDLNPMLHTWSLAVEEQYYLLFPPLMVGLWRLGRGWTAACLSLTALFSLLLAEHMSDTAPTANYFLPVGRIWELLVGALVAIFRTDGWVRGRFAGSAAAAGVVLLIFSVWLLDSTTPFPSFWALIPISGTALVIGFASSTNWTGQVLSTRPLVGLGLCSYSVYLWHQPIFAFARVRSLAEPSSAVFVMLTALSIALGGLTWKYVEAPFRNKAFLSRNQVLWGSGGALILVAIVGGIGHKTRGFADHKFSQVGEEARMLLSGLEEARQLRGTTWARLMAAPGPEAPFDTDTSRRRVLVLGDSLSSDAFVALHLGGASKRFQVRRLSFDDLCMDRLNKRNEGDDKCSTEARGLKNSRLFRDADLLLVTAGWDADAPKLVDQFLADLGRREVVVFGTSAFATMPSLLYHIGSRRIPSDKWPEFFGQNMHEPSRSASEKLADVAVKHGARYANKYEAFCPDLGHPAKCVLMDDEEKPLLIDQSHLSVKGAHRLAEWIEREGLLERAK